MRLAAACGARRDVSHLPGARGALAGNYAALAVALVSQLVLLPLLLTRLGATGAGFFVLLWSAVNFAGTAIGWLSAGGTVLLTRAAAAGSESMLAALYRRFARGMALYGLVGWVVFGLWSAGVGSLWWKELPASGASDMRIAVHGAGAYMLAINVHQADLALLTARLEQGRVAFYRAMLQVLILALGLLGILSGGGVAAMFLGYAAAAMITAAAAHLTVRRTAWPRVAADTPRVLDDMPTSLGGFAWYSIAFSLLQYSDVLILSLFGGPTAVVVLTFLQRLPEAAILLIVRASETLGPYYTAMAVAPDRGPLQQTFLTASRVIWRVAAVSGVGFAVFGRDVVQWWSRGKVELPPHWYFAGAGIVLAAGIINRNAGLLAYFSGSTAGATRLILWELGLRVVLVVTLVHRLGPTAPMVAALVAQLLVLLLAYRKLEGTVLQLRPSALLERCLWPALTSAVPATVLMVVLRSQSTAAVSQRGVALLAAAIGVAALLAVQERALGVQFLRRRRA